MRNPVKFGDYYLFERVAVGGMAEVFKGVSYGVEGFERLFAVKRVLPSIAEDNEFIEMFIDEAKIAVQLTHANIGQVFELGNAEGAYFIAMEFVQGKDLRAVFDRSRKHGASLHVAMCCHVIKEVCEALEYAHNKRNDQQQPISLIHRDVSPQNIIVSYDGGVKLIDFGIAKAAGKASKTQAGILKGKFGYMSPEQVRGRPIDKRSDLFSLAVVFYELLTLERCFQGESDFSTLETVRTVDIRRPISLNRDIPPELERILLKGLAKTPEQRYQSAAEFQDALQKYLYQSGNFYSRKDLTRYMKETFGRELEDEQRRMTAFRQYARQHIREARRDASVDIEVSKATAEPFTPDLPALSWEQEEIETSIWDRSPSALTAAPDLSSSPPAQPGLVAAITDRPMSAAPNGLRSTSLLPPIDRAAAQQAPQRGQYSATAQLSAVQPADLRMPVGANAPRTSQRLIVLLGLVGLLLALGVGAWWMTREARSMHSLKVDAYPSTVELFVDGVSRGEQATPTTIQLIPGPHIIGAVAQGYVEARQEVQLTGPLKLEFRLVAAAGGTGLTVETEPAGATVYIDGQALAQSTPVEARSIDPGLRKLRIEKDGYLRWAGTVTAAEG
ncbi:MAG: serine/threonine protein kinase, partial [Bradymonadia bacterium]